MSSKKKVHKKTVSSAKPANKKRKSTFSSFKWSVTRQAPLTGIEDIYKKIFWIAFAAMVIVTLWMGVVSGINEDEQYHYPYMEALMNYYGTFGEDGTAASAEYWEHNEQTKRGRMNLYGGFVDIMTGAVNKLLGFTIEDIAFHQIRHVILALVGLIGILFTGLLGRLLGGWRAGVLSLFILFLSPRFLGHTGINPRDIPFASGYIMAIYFAIRFFIDGLTVRWSTIVGLIGGLALAFSTRSGGLLLFAYIGLFALLYAWRYHYERVIAFHQYFRHLLIYGGIAMVGGYFGALLFWPYGLEGPIQHVIESLTKFSNYATVIRMLFAGEMLWSNTIPPAQYVFTWLGIAMPLILLFGVAMLILLGRYAMKRYQPINMLMLFFVVGFPIVYMIYKGSNLYTGMRHILFLVPPLAVLAGLGWHLLGLYAAEKKPLYAKVVAGAFGLLCLLPLSHIATNFSTCYVYFNEIVGGVRGAQGYYEMDYWGISNKQAAEWLKKEGAFDRSGKKVIAGNSIYVLRTYLQDIDSLSVRYSRFRERYQREWDHAVYINQFIDGAHLRTGNVPDGRAIKTIGKGEVPFAMIYENTSPRYATDGYNALKQKNYDEAITQFTKELAQNPTNENVAIGLADAYMAKGQLSQAAQALEKALDINPGSQSALQRLPRVLISQGKADAALDYLDTALKLNDRDFGALYYRGFIHSQAGRSYEAIEDLKKSIELNPRNRQAFELIIQNFNKVGDQAQAKHFQQLMKQYAK